MFHKYDIRTPDIIKISHKKQKNCLDLRKLREVRYELAQVYEDYITLIKPKHGIKNFNVKDYFEILQNEYKNIGLNNEEIKERIANTKHAFTLTSYAIYKKDLFFDDQNVKIDIYNFLESSLFLLCDQIPARSSLYLSYINTKDLTNSREIALQAISDDLEIMHMLHTIFSRKADMFLTSSVSNFQANNFDNKITLEKTANSTDYEKYKAQIIEKQYAKTHQVFSKLHKLHFAKGAKKFAKKLKYSYYDVLGESE